MFALGRINRCRDGGSAKLWNINWLLVLTTAILFVFNSGGIIPYDGVPREEIVTVHLALPAVFITLGCTGIAFAIACLIFNFVYRNAK